METAEKNIPELRFPEFDDIWIKGKIGKVSSKVGSGKTPKGGEEVYTKEGIPFIRSQNVINDSLLLDDTHIPLNVHEAMKSSCVKSNDILLNITGGSIGRSCVVPSDFTEGNVNQHVCIIRLNQNNPKFFQSFLSSWKGQRQVFQGQTGSGREGLNFESIKGFMICYPSLPEQQKIANFLSSVDAKIEQLTQKKQLLEQYKKGVMQQIFSQQLRFKDEAGNNYSDWEVKKLREVCFLQGGFAFKSIDFKDKGIPVIRISNISNHNNNIDVENMVYFDKIQNHENFVIRKGKLLIAMSGATTGKSCVYSIEQDGYLNQRVGMFNSTTDNLCYEFLVQFVFSVQFQNQLSRLLVAGAQPNISSKDIESLKIPFPAKEEQTQIANFLSAIDKKIDLVNTQLENTKAFKKGLLQQMFV